jgi:hypothetical protein
MHPMMLAILLPLVGSAFRFLRFSRLRLLGLHVGAANHLPPPRQLAGDQISEGGGRGPHRLRTLIGERLQDIRQRQCRVDRLPAFRL